MKRLTIIVCLLGLCLATPLGATHKQVGHNSQRLEELDNLLRDAKVYVGVREERIAYLTSQLNNSSDPNLEYMLLGRLFDEYFSYNFDAALNYGNRAADLARTMHNRPAMAESNLRLAQLYTIAGMYSEAFNLFGRIDTLALPKSNMADYYLARIHFNRDFREYSKDEAMRHESALQLDYYRKQFYNLSSSQIDLYENYTIDSLNTRLLEYYDNGDYVGALECAQQAESLTNPTQHIYAIVAYYKSMVYEQWNDQEHQIEWLLRSAMTDIRLAIKDHASLCTLASLMAQNGDVERAFRYIRISTDDAHFFNAKLRQWQVASRMNTIEDAYHASVREQQKSTQRTTIIVSLLAVVLLVAFIYVGMLLHRTAKTQSALRAKKDELEAVNRTLKETNQRLSELNMSIAEANMVKEEYIGLFLSMCSDYIDKIASMQRRVRKGIKSGSIAELNREFPSSDIIDAEKEHFYEVFDSAFLSLYPNFVEEFNSLLEEDGRIEPKGESLTTELRIFALIRLGITDSSKIALLLHYSVNTIYNYRAKVKNRAKGNRDNFEQVIRTIGAFKA